MIIFLISLLLSIKTCYGLNILMYISAMGHSHISFNGNIAEILIDAGHNVTILHQYLDPDVKSIATDKASRYITYKAENVDFSGFLNMTAKTSACFNPNRQTGTDLPMLFNTRLKVCESIVNNDELLNTLKQTKYDLAISEYNEECQEGLFEILGIKTTIMTSAIPIYNPIYHNHGITNLPSVFPSIILPYTPQMSLKQRAVNTFVNYKIEELYSKTLQKMTSFYREKFGSDFPELLELRRQKTAYTFLNAYEHFEFPTFLTSKIKFVGGIQPRNNVNQIPDKMMDIINSKKGFVILSFGTFARSHTVPEHIRHGISLAFKEFPDYAFFWKYNIADNKDLTFLNGSKNIYLESWLPQYAMLNHPKCKLFITHCGANSVSEAVHAGVPMLAVPLFSDQMHNAAVVADRKVGILLGKENLSQVGVTFALKQLLKDQDSLYHIQAKMYSNRIKDSFKITTPEEIIIKHTEYAAKYGNMPDMDLETVNLSFYKIYMLDIIIPILGFSLILIFLLFLIIKSIFKQLFIKNSKKRKTE